MADPTAGASDITYLAVWCGEKSRLEELVRTLRPKHSIALDMDTGMPCTTPSMHVLFFEEFNAGSSEEVFSQKLCEASATWA